jgi:hypothetical protein
MPIYQRNNENYRKIYEDFYGPIPLDEQGRTYEIHHIDNNPHNNHPSNLKAVSIQEHFDIHASQGDWYACMLIGSRLNITPEEKSELARKHNKNLVDKGLHHFMGPELQKRRVEEGTHPWQNKEWHSKREKEKVNNGTHIFLDGEVSRQITQKRLKEGTHNFIGNTYMKDFWNNADLQTLKQRKEEASQRSKKLVANGTHHFIGSEERTKAMHKRLLAEGKHHSQISHTCPHCHKTGRGVAMFKHHFDRCKLICK